MQLVTLTSWGSLEPQDPQASALPDVAEFPLNVQLVTLGLLSMFNIPPPALSVTLAMNVQLITVGLLLMFHMPPPKRP